MSRRDLDQDQRNQVVAREIEELYDQALAAYWTERWDRAVVLLRQVNTYRHDHPDVAVKLELALRQQQLDTRYAQACAAVEARDWEQAVAGFTAVADADPTYRDVGERLEIARRQQQIAGLEHIRQAATLQEEAPGDGNSVPGRVPRRLVALAVRVLPVRDRSRYAEEFRVELGELPRSERWGYVLRTLTRAWELRRALTETVRTPDGAPARRVTKR